MLKSNKKYSLDKVKELIKRFENYYRNINGRTVIHKACIEGRTSIIKRLVTEYSCDLNARDKAGDTPVTVACLGGSVECVELLINEFHCDINTKAFNGRTILHHACNNGHTSLVRHLVTKYGLDLNARDKDGDTPFTVACLGGSVECVELLINEFHCDINTTDFNERTILHKACSYGQTSLVRLLITKYVCSLNARDKDGDTPFTVAGLSGNVECVKLLIKEFHCDISTKDFNGRTILHKACNKGHTSLVRLLITKYGCSLNARDKDGDTPFTVTGLSGNVECVELLIKEFHCDISTKDFNGRTILHKACNQGHTSLVGLLITKYNCDLNARDNDGDTPFTSSGLSGYLKCVELLIDEFHADIRTEDFNGRTILHKACGNGHTSLVRLLVRKYRCDLNALDNVGDTPFTIAGYSGNVECVEVLINEFHCNVKGMTSKHISILHNAYISGQINLIRVLVIKYGCDLKLCDGKNCGASNEGLKVIEKLKKSLNGMRYLELVDKVKLGLDELEVVDRAISTIRESWYEFGAFLGVKMSHLEDLKGLPSGQMRKIIEWWLCEETRVFDYFMEPCWQTLVKAIAHPAGGDNVPAAEELALSHLVPADARFIGSYHCDEICSELKGLVDKWYELGINLEVDMKTLEYLKSFDIPELCTKQMVMEWLKLNSSLGYLPTWDHLIKAIAKMNLQEMAKQLQQSHPVIKYVNSGNTMLKEVKIGESCLLEVVETIAELKNQWQAVGLALNLAPSVVKVVSGTTTKDCLTEVVKLWLRQNARSWQGLVDCLENGLWGDNISIVTRIINNQPKGMPEDNKMERKKLYDEAIEKGCVECCTIKCLIHGLAGVGKTHVKHLLLNIPPPELRTSTGIADNPARAVTVSAVGVSKKDEDKWHVLDGDYDLMHAVSKMIEGCVVPLPEPDHHSEHPTRQMSSPVPDGGSDGGSDGISSNVPTSYAAPDLPPKKSDDIDEIQPNTASNTVINGELGQSLSELDQTDITESHMSVEEGIISLIKQLSGDKEHLKMKWIQLIDSGGQPQFHHILPLFVHNLSVVMFVLKLSEELNHKPQVLYYGSDGKAVGKAYQSPFSHKEVLERCLKAVHVHSSPTCPVVIVIGTHKDKQDCNETMEVKNESILTCLNTNNITNKALYTSETMKEVIFAVNSQKPTPEDKNHAQYLRREISKLTPVLSKMPIAWFCLEVSLRVLTQRKRREVLSLSECKHTAERFQIKDKALIAALKYFVECNILLYYPEVLPNMVFCNPQVILSIITELVQYRYKLMGNPDSTKPISGEWQRFKDYAYVTLKQLDSFPGHYHKDVFSSSDLLKLFINHSIVAPVGNEEYLMPALLPALPHDNMPSLQLSGDPLLIRLKKGCFPSGVFCSLVAHLLNDASCKLSLCIKDNKPKCLYSNSVTFKCSNYPATITIVDGNSHFAIYIHVELNCEPHSSMRTCVHRGTISACTQLGCQCTQEDIVDAVYCSHDDCKGQEKHLADISAQKNDSWTTCSHDGSRIMPLVESQKLWFSAEGSTNAVAPSSSAHLLSEQIEAQARSKLKDTPTMLELLSFSAEKLNVALLVGAKYYTFGIFLLEDKTGAIVNALEIEHLKNAERINMAIIQQWLQGKGVKPVKWSTLVTVLQKIEM